MVLVAATLFLGALVPNLLVLAPSFLAARGHDSQEIGVIMGSFNLASLLAMPAVGRVIDRSGHRLVLAAGCAIAGLGCAGFGAAASTPGYVAARAVQGMGFSAVLVGGASYVAEIAPPGRLAQALGISGVLTLASQAVGPALGELLEHTLGWPWVIRAGVVAGVLGGLVATALPPAARNEEAAVPGVLPALPILGATALAGFGFGSVWSFLADYSDRVGIGAVTPFFAPYVICAVSTRIFLGHLPDTLGRRRVAVPALALHAVALLGMSAVGELWQLVAIGGMFGLAHGVYYPTLQAMVVERSPAGRSRAIASSTFAFGLGIVVAAIGLGAMAKATGYPPIYFVAAGAGATGALVVWARG